MQVCYWALWANPGEAAGHCKLWAVLIYAERFPCVHKRQVTSLTQTYVVFQLLTRHNLKCGLISKVDVSFCPGKLQHISLIAVKSNLFKILCHIKYVVVGCDCVALHFHVQCGQTNCLLLNSNHREMLGRLCYINTIFSNHLFLTSGIRPISGSSWAPFTPVMNAQYRASLWTSNSMPNTSR